MLLAVAGYAGYSYLRIKTLIARSQPLLQTSNSFKRDYFVGEPGARGATYVVLGDSTAVGYGVDALEQSYAHQVAASWAKSGRYVHVINLAVSGARLRDVVNLQMPRLEKLSPDLISISVGANDATHGTSPAEYRDLLAKLLTGLQTTRAGVLLANTPDMYQAPALPLPFAILAGKRARRQNQMLAKAMRSTQFRGVDLYDRGKLIYRRDKGLYAADLFHPTARGYSIWADLFAEELP